MPVNEIAVPFLNMSKSGMSLRRDSELLLSKLDIDKDSLIYNSEMGLLRRLSNLGKLRLHLVDHNELSIETAGFAASVVQVVDHHFDADSNFPNLPSRKKRIAECASTSTQITNLLQATRPEALTPDLALFLLGAILLDTANFTRTDLVTARDTQALKILRSKLKFNTTEEFYASLEKARKDISGMSFEQILQKDLKFYQKDWRYGISTLPKTFYWEEKANRNYAKALHQICKEKKLDFLLVLMSGETQDKFMRKFKVHCCDQSMATEVFKIFEKPGIKKFLYAISSIDNHFRTFYSELPLSRKQMQPLMD